ncbi:TPA: hypothetical protein ACH3X1_007246 [Trebouxia sp. C0004]
MTFLWNALLTSCAIAKDFLAAHVFRSDGNGILGRVKSHVIRYENSKQEAKAAEYYWIRHYDTQNSSGYNNCKRDPATDKRFSFLCRLNALH